jgi:hypothetical protein
LINYQLACIWSRLEYALSVPILVIIFNDTTNNTISNDCSVCHLLALNCTPCTGLGVRMLSHLIVSLPN